MLTYNTINNDTSQTNLLFFRQDLPHNVAVTAWKNQPEIELTFGKHKHSVLISNSRVDDHLRDLKRNLKAYLSARQNVGKEPLSIRGYGDMTLRFNERNEGVCIEDYLCIAATEKEYDYYAAALRKARDITL
ncbi:MAG: hypothetical protein EOM40_06640 [Clostridia bacterium]|nr:hypothetical protein [Clostridia bacterium]NCC43172.1 hypothetical protein [Clostridia bacterium]